MQKYTLEEYTHYTQYFILFDVIFKINEINKEEFLFDNDINPSSYRRSKQKEQKIGHEIAIKLAKLFSIKIVDKEYIHKVEALINAAYYDMYYKIFTRYDKYTEEILELKKDNTILSPVICLLDLFLKINSRYYSNESFEGWRSEYLDLKKYYAYFSEQLLSIFRLLEITFENDLAYQNIEESKNDGFSYFIRSFVTWKHHDYLASLYFSTKAREILNRENNFKRLSYVNLNHMSSLNYLENYEDCYSIAERQLLYLESISADSVEIKRTEEHLMMSALGLDKYDEIIEMLRNKKKMDLNQFSSLLVAYSKTDMEEYKRYYNCEIKKTQFPDNVLEYFKLLNEFILTHNKKLIINFEKYNVSGVIINIYKKLY